MARYRLKAPLCSCWVRLTAAIAHGARLVLGGKRIDRPGSYMQPTILTDVTPGNPAFRDEFFGPVAMFFRVKDEDAAIALANDSAISVWAVRCSPGTSPVASGWRAGSRPA